MNLSAKVEYACLAVLELANRFEQGEPVRLRSISEAHGIPSPFLVQIMQQLRAAGIVESTRGSAGGYQLTRDPDQISLLMVKEVIEGTSSGSRVCSNLADSSATNRVLLDAWQRVEDAERQVLAEVTFGSLLERVRGRGEKMYYI